MWGSSNEYFPMGEILRKLLRIIMVPYKNESRYVDIIKK